MRHLAFLSGLASLLTITRWPLSPKYLFYFDAVNMAMAIEEFAPGKHQPQPPGYPFFVALLKAIHALGFNVENTMLVSGVVTGTLTGWFLWRFCTDLGNSRAGWMAALIYIFSPVFWFNSLTNQSRGFSAVASAGTAWFTWRASRPDSHPGWLIGATCFLATMMGFRPVESLMLTPLLLWAVWKRRPHWTTLSWSVLAGIIPVLVWGGWLLAATGGLTSYMNLMRQYSAEQNIFEASGAWRAFWKVLEYVFAIHLVCILPWIWTFFWNRPQLNGKGIFFLIWILPGLTFQLLGHAADPCHLLATITAFCWLGGLSLAGIPQWRGVMAIVVTACLGTALFLSPLVGFARATSYFVVKRVNAEVSEAIDTARAAAETGPMTIVLRDSIVTWRHLRYYLPHSPLWVDTQPRWSPSETKLPLDETPGPFVLIDKKGTRVVSTLPAVSP